MNWIGQLGYGAKVNVTFTASAAPPYDTVAWYSSAGAVGRRAKPEIVAPGG